MVSNPDFELQPPAFRWRLWHLFYVTAFFSAGLAVSPFSWVASMVWTLICVFALHQRSRAIGLRIFAYAAVVVCFFGCCVILPPVNRLQKSSERRLCQLQMLALHEGLEKYAGANQGRFPEVRSLNVEGEPMHSWRVRILPYIGETQLYAEYDFDEPWDGPNNLLLHDQMPSVFRCPSCDHGNRTHYKLVSGQGTPFADSSIPMNEIAVDGVSTIGGVVEDSRRSVPWLEPTEFTIDQAIEAYCQGDFASVPHRIESWFWIEYWGFNVVYLDGAKRMIGANSDPVQIRHLFGPSDGPAVHQSIHEGYRREYKLSAIVAAMIFVILAWLPLYKVWLKPKRS